MYTLILNSVEGEILTAVKIACTAGTINAKNVRTVGPWLHSRNGYFRWVFEENRLKEDIGVSLKTGSQKIISLDGDWSPKN
jgi:hypothetical protein